MRYCQNCDIVCKAKTAQPNFHSVGRFSYLKFTRLLKTRLLLCYFTSSKVISALYQAVTNTCCKYETNKKSI